MKFYAAFLVFGAVLVSRSWAISKEDLIKKATEIAQNCQTKENAVDQDIAEFFAEKVPTTETGKCFRACIMESFNVMVDNKPSLENAIKLASDFTNGNEEAIQLTRELHEECNPTAIGANRCETAFNIIKCSLASMDRRGVDHSKFHE